MLLFAFRRKDRSTELEILDYNGDLVAEKTGLAIQLTDGKKINGFHLVTFLGGMP